MSLSRSTRLVLCLALVAGFGHAAEPKAPAPPLPGDELLRNYFRDETARIAKDNLAEIKIAADWNAKKDEYRRQLADMLGLDPMPPRTDLKPVITGKIDHPDFTVEKLHFQSMPGLYVTGNLYIPKNLDKPAPTILYVCGHSPQKKDGVSFGNKAGYQHHGGWFARNGYVCLTIDTLQLGEIEGIHHGLYREKMWWWQSRGYTSAGVEAWNGIRALDYLETRPEVDKTRFGITGRSGGGAYSWWVAALDERIKAAVPVAGITDMTNHVVDGCISGHCDCMYVTNTYRWDYSSVAALVAPRPLLIANSDKDGIFPLDGVQRVHADVARIYKLLGASDKLGLLITEGPHKDTQDLQVPAFRWFNRWLKNDIEPVKDIAVKFFEPPQLRVFEKLPADQINTKIQESFIPVAAAPQVPASAQDWTKQRDAWLAGLKEKTFRGWQANGSALSLGKPMHEKTAHGVTLRRYELESQPHVPLDLIVVTPEGKPAKLVVLNVVDQPGWDKTTADLADADLIFDPQIIVGSRNAFASTARMISSNGWGMAYVAPRGAGEKTAWSGDEKKQTHILRRFWLLGQTLDGQRVWDTRRSIQALRALPDMKDVPLWLQGERRMAGIALYASLFESGIARLDLYELPTTHMKSPHGPDLLNVLRVLDMPAALAMAAERSKVRLYQDGDKGWEYPQAVAKALGWGEDRIQIRELPKEEKRPAARRDGNELLRVIPVVERAAPDAAPAQPRAAAKDASTLQFTTRSRKPVADDSPYLDVIEKTVEWDPKETALIICDMWDVHWCKSATQRTGEIAPHIDALAKGLRARGGLVIHAPSDTMKFYADTPQRKLAQSAPKVAPPSPPNSRGGPALPIDDTDNGCDDVPQCTIPNGKSIPYPWKKQIDTIQIADGDAITDNGQEVYNLLQQRGIKHLLVCGVHTNMCILHRTFAIKQMTRWGVDTVLVRDLTDSMYNPRKSPFVPHHKGTDLVREYIEQHWCPSTLSADILGDAPKPKIVVITGEQEYKASETLPKFFKDEAMLRQADLTFINSDDPKDIPGLKALDDADLLLLYARRRTLPDEQLAKFRHWCASGKPIVALRTSSHAFQTWLEFDRQVLGGTYGNHYGNKGETTVRIHPEAGKHPLLRGVSGEFITRGSLYKSSPLAETARPLLTGTWTDKPAEPVAWTNTHQGGRVFYTSLGHAEDFATPAFRALLRNAVLWALDKPVPAAE